jgi:membrane glycosyltransferase
MLQRQTPDDATTIDPSPAMTGRRVLFATLVVTTIVGLLWLMAVTLSVGGLNALDYVILVLFGITLPWTVVGFWNATIGFLIMRFAPDPTAIAVPSVRRVRGDEQISSSVAVLVCIRNEIPDRVIRNLEPMMNGLVATGFADRFHVYVLSDTAIPDIAIAEERSFGALRAKWGDRIALTYRRRTLNTGYKAGNIRDFCNSFGHRHELAVTLDADSFMPAEAILRLVRIMQGDPKLGILQGLVVGLPSTSAFARLFQVGMRLGMRSYTIGSAWWQGDCGSYWGHNAVIRLAPFILHCELPILPKTGPLGGFVLSHDQIEAVLMRRAGYEVRVLPEEELGWEENPPTLIEFIRRDLRWCQGNMQYWHFVGLPGLKPVSRYQVAFALIWFLASPAWIGLLVAGTVGVAIAGPENFVRPGPGLLLFALTAVMWFAPKIASVVDVLMRRDAREAFGGTARFLAGIIAETGFAVLLSPIMWFGHTVFLIRLVLGGGIGWIGQTRDDHAVPVSLALAQLWPQTVLGLASLGLLAATAPAAIPYAFIISAGGLALSVPLAVITASPALGRAFARIGLGRLPEETAPPPALRALALPAVEMAAPSPHPAARPCSEP